MIISEKQIFQLIRIASDAAKRTEPVYYEEYRLAIYKLLNEIDKQQSEELREINE